MPDICTIIGALAGAVAFMVATIWLIFRAMAERCPNCRSRWRTEMVARWAEWGGDEEWRCCKCERIWIVKKWSDYDGV